MMMKRKRGKSRHQKKKSEKQTRREDVETGRRKKIQRKERMKN